MNVINPNKITALQQALKKLGIEYSIDQLRKLEKAGIVFSSRTEKGQRIFTKEQFDKSIRNICYYYMGASIEDIKANGEVLRARGRQIIKVAKSLITK